MARYKRFTFLCDSDQRRILAALALRLQQSQSDAIRWLITNVAQELGLNSISHESGTQPVTPREQLAAEFLGTEQSMTAGASQSASSDTALVIVESGATINIFRDRSQQVVQ